MEESVIKRVMPNSLEAEQSVIGSMIMDREAVMAASEILTTEDFYHKQYGILFEAMLELFNDGQPVDLVTLQNRLKEKKCTAGSQQFRVCGKHRGSSTNFCKYQILCKYRKRKGTLTGNDPHDRRHRKCSICTKKTRWRTSLLIRKKSILHFYRIRVAETMFRSKMLY